MLADFLFIRPATCTSTCTAGYVRHPMYGGLLLASVGLSMLTRNETRLALACLLWYVLEQKVRWRRAIFSASYLVNVM